MSLIFGSFLKEVHCSLNEIIRKQTEMIKQSFKIRRSIELESDFQETLLQTRLT